MKLCDAELGNLHELALYVAADKRQPWLGDIANSLYREHVHKLLEALALAQHLREQVSHSQRRYDL
jgi:hypothetical protein